MRILHLSTLFLSPTLLNAYNAPFLPSGNTIRLSSRTALFDSKQQNSRDIVSTENEVSNESPSSSTNGEIKIDVDETDTIIRSKVNKYFPDVDMNEQYLTYNLREHKPLGCTAEENLAERDDGMQFAFISKIVDAGNAQKAGLEIGDVIVGLSGTFDELVDVFGVGLDRVRSLVAGRPAEKDLVVKVIRGTSILDEHETALVDICLLPEGEGKDSTLQDCITALYKSDYEVDDVVGPSTCDDSDADCMLDAMADIWGEETSMGEKSDKQKEADEAENKAKKPAPWSSRSSPSGTYVRDPATGKMVNIDEQ